MPSWLSLPATRNLTCCKAKRARSELVKNFLAARPLAKWKIDAPIIIVLSTSKKAPAVRSGDAAPPSAGPAGSACSMA
jgi:hypothetical protein